jgi:formate dehydrogenase (NADP+) beta subunit
VATITIKIDGVEVKTTKGKRILEAALDAGIYIPNLCSLRDIKLAYGACRLCQVEIEGQAGKRNTVTACSEPAVDGMVIRSNTKEINNLRRKILEIMLARHPHNCLTCHKRAHCKPGDICLRFVCVNEEQCILCGKNGRCELQTAVDFIGMDETSFPYRSKGLPVEMENPYIVRNNNLCILCGRCVRVCEEILGIEAIAFNKRGAKTVITGVLNRPLLESGCIFCGSCVEACPTGALSYAGYQGDTWPEREVCPVLCQYNCPAGVDVPRFIRYVNAGKPAEALEVIQEKVPLARVCSHICSHPCETACRRNGLNGPVSIRALERAAVNQAPGTELKVSQPAADSGKKVAIVGSGPAALTAAYYLAKSGGHQVAIMENQPAIGGNLRNIKDLPSEVLDADVSTLTKLGVKINTKVKDISADKLFEQGFNAVFVTSQPAAKPEKIDPADLSTGKKGLYASGELINPNISFIDAVAEGRKAAKSIDLYLGGKGNIEEVLATIEEQIPKVGLRQDFPLLPRNEEPPKTGLSKEAALAETRRCMNCDIRVRIAKMVEQPPVPVKHRANIK